MTKFLMIFGSGLIALSGCNDTGFTPAAKVSNLTQTNGNPNPAPSCKVTVGTSKKDIRILFMLDNSGSTNTTDPQQEIRVKTIQKFIADYGAKTNLTYSLGYFSGSTATIFDMNTSQFKSPLATTPVGNSGQLSVALAAYDAINPEGNTPYRAAFSSMNGTVTGGVTGGGKEDFAVVFMSDGQPTDIANPVNTNLMALVDNLKKAGSGNGGALTLSTVYFGPTNDTTSIDHLQSMATRGEGQFVDTNKLTAGGLVINDIINVPGTCE